MLSDETKCDPGTIVAMAGQLGYLACGLELWHVDNAVLPFVLVNRGYDGQNQTVGKSGLFDVTTGQRKTKFDDLAIAASSHTAEQFFYHMNPHPNTRDGECMCGTGPNYDNGSIPCISDYLQGHGNCDGEIEYSSGASGAAHALGRVTCPVSGETTLTPGFFHHATEGTAKQRFNAGLSALRGRLEAGPIRTGQPVEETNFNPESTFRNMPTWFARNSGLAVHTVPRYVANMDNHRQSGSATWSETQTCRHSMRMFIPYELAEPESIQPAKPSSPALNRFEAIAFD